MKSVIYWTGSIVLRGLGNALPEAGSHTARKLLQTQWCTQLTLFKSSHTAAESLLSQSDFTLQHISEAMSLDIL